MKLYIFLECYISEVIWLLFLFFLWFSDRNCKCFALSVSGSKLNVYSIRWKFMYILNAFQNQIWARNKNEVGIDEPIRIKLFLNEKTRAINCARIKRNLHPICNWIGVLMRESVNYSDASDCNLPKQHLS